MIGDLSRVKIDEVPNAMMRDAPEFGPVPQGADARFLALRENSAEAKTDDVGKLILIR